MKFVKAIIITLGTYLSFTTLSFLQEKMYSKYSYINKQREPFDYPEILVFSQLFLSFILSSICKKNLVLMISPNSKRPFPPFSIIFFYGIAFSYSMLMTNYSLTLISYPAQVMIKSCKLIPAMFGAYWVRGMQYNKYQYLSAALITFGMILFNLEGKNHQNSNLFKGILACATSLILGGFTSYFIEKLRSEYNPTSLSIQQFCSASGVFFILPFVLGKNFITSQQSILEYSLKYPDVIIEIVIYGVVGAIGNSFIFWGLKCYGSLNVIIITTTRKALTVIISILWYSHNFTDLNKFSIMLLIAGALVSLFEIFSRRKKSEKKQE